MTNPTQPVKFTTDQIRRLMIFGCAVIAILIIVFYLYKIIMVPVLLSLFLAYLVTPIVDRLV